MDVTAAVANDSLVTLASEPRLTRLLLRRKIVIACLAYLGALLVVALVAPLVFPHVMNQPAGDLLNVRKGPSSEHLLGTDTLGRDVLQRLLVGTRPTMIGIFEATFVILIVGVPLGLLAGFLGGWLDTSAMWIANLSFSIPTIILILVVLSVFPASMTAGMVTYGLLVAPWMMRVTRGAVLQVKADLYVDAAKVSGLSRSRIVMRHIRLRVAGPVIVQASLVVAWALLAQSGLAFLGLLTSTTTPTWGGMVNDGVSVIVLDPWLLWPPGIAIVLTVLAIGLLGDAVRDATTERWAPRVTKRTDSNPRRQVESVRPECDGDGGGGLLCVEGLSAHFTTPTGEVVRVVEDVTFDVRAGEIVGVVGESGCGKTATMMAVLGLLPGTGQVGEGRIMFSSRDLVTMSERDRRRIRGRKIALISQEPMMGLDPCFRVDSQIGEVVHEHLGLRGKARSRRVLELLLQVHIPDPERVARYYPHQLSGGMAQRVAIARALAGEPELLIADEPTTALDVTVQAEILDLLRELQQRRQMAVILVSHDWGVVADLCDRVVVMYAGEVVERAETARIFHQPLHPYTKALLAANPENAPDGGRLPSIPGVVPRPGQWPTGCRFHPRCSFATADCMAASITLSEPSPGREARCIRLEAVRVAS